MTRINCRMGIGRMLCRKVPLFILITITVVTFWFIYVFLLEESQLHFVKQKLRHDINYDNTSPGHDKINRLRDKNFNIDYKLIYQGDNLNVKDGLKVVAEQAKEENNSLIFKNNNLFSPDRVADYCNVPNSPESGAEGDCPDGYELKSVYTVIRHGDRTTLYTFAHHRNPIISCKYQTELSSLGLNKELSSLASHPKIASYAQTMIAFKGKQNIGSKFQSWSLFPNHKICDNSFLTPHGVLQHILNGVHFNEKYVKKLNLFGPEFTPNQVNIKVTEYSRTYQSALALLYGFLPHFNLTELNVQRAKGVLFCSDKLVGSFCACPAIQYYKRISTRDVSMSHMSDKIQDIHETISNVYGIEVNQLPFNFAMFDILSSYACHGIKLPCNDRGQCITRGTVSGLAGFLDEYGAALEKSASFKKYNSLAIYSLLLDIGQHMTSVIHGRTHEKFTLYSGHDKTVAPLLSVLGVNQGRLVGYGTRVVFELYRRHDAKDHHYVRILHDGKDVTSQVQFCRRRTKNGLCKIKHFQKFIQEDILTDIGERSFAKGCQNIPKRRRKFLK